MGWDWAQSGKLKDGKPYKQKGAFGKYEYLSIKGQVKWAKNVQPEYFWFNGSIDSLTAADTIDPGQVVPSSHPAGDRTDPIARIFPFKVHRGNQPYDQVHKTFLAPLLSGAQGLLEIAGLAGCAPTRPASPGSAVYRRVRFCPEHLCVSHHPYGGPQRQRGRLQ
jgi:hypothetical protein